MFNLLVAYGDTAWDEGVFEFPRERVAIEYTEDAISERYKELIPEVIEELKSIPSIFSVENEQAASRVGYIKTIKVKEHRVRTEVSFEPTLAPLPPGFLADSSVLFDLGRFELSRTHWAIKEGDLWSILEKKGIDCSHLKASGQLRAVQSTSSSAIAQAGARRQVFIVHGHDEVPKYEMASAIRELGCEPIILHEQASGGLTIIEKIEKYTDVGFAVVLYTPCDIGGKRALELQLSPRARQNVVFEHGYLMSKLGRNRVMAFVRGTVETPSDISGVVYIEMDTHAKWKTELMREMRAVGQVTK